MHVEVKRIKQILCLLIAYCLPALIIHAVALDNLFQIENGSGEQLIAEAVFQSDVLIWQVVIYISIVIVLSLLPALLIYIAYGACEEILRKKGLSCLSYYLLASVSFWIAILHLNSVYFPRSSFSMLIPYGNEVTANVFGGIALALTVFLIFLPILYRLKAVLKFVRKPLFIAGMCVCVGLVWAPGFGGESPAHTNKPNIIIIGVDSLSPEHMYRNPGKLPGIDSLLNQGTRFNNAITPLGRTFPAWTGILTGQHPVNSGARFNLTNFDQVNNEVTLAHILRSHGYKTVYAQDERKFNNIDESFGFDRVVGPKVGVAEFILTKVSDLPIVNLVLLIPGSSVLFPFIAENRADDLHYNPESFVRSVLSSLSPSQQPLFMATHLCLAHYPYTWRTQGKVNKTGDNSFEGRHLYALSHVEMQVQILLSGLKTKGYLDNAIVVFLSDHGEGMNYENDLWLNKEKANIGRVTVDDKTETLRKLVFSSGFSGHGADVLSKSQNRVMLSFSGYGSFEGYFERQAKDDWVSLIDVMPTVLGAVGLSAPLGIDGVDLNEVGEDYLKSRILFGETGITFDSMASIDNIDEDKLLKESRRYYDVVPQTARLVVKKEFYKDLVGNKDIAVHYGEWMIAFLRKLPDSLDSPAVILVNKSTGRWTDGNDYELISQAPISHMINQMKKSYDKELSDFDGAWINDHITKL